MRLILYIANNDILTLMIYIFLYIHIQRQQKMKLFILLFYSIFFMDLLVFDAQSVTSQSASSQSSTAQPSAASPSKPSFFNRLGNKLKKKTGGEQKSAAINSSRASVTPPKNVKSTYKNKAQIESELPKPFAKVNAAQANKLNELYTGSQTKKAVENAIKEKTDEAGLLNASINAGKSDHEDLRRKLEALNGKLESQLWKILGYTESSESQQARAKVLNIHAEIAMLDQALQAEFEELTLINEQIDILNQSRANLKPYNQADFSKNNQFQQVYGQLKADQQNAPGYNDLKAAKSGQVDNTQAVAEVAKRFMVKVYFLEKMHQTFLGYIQKFQTKIKLNQMLLSFMNDTPDLRKQKIHDYIVTSYTPQQHEILTPAEMKLSPQEREILFQQKIAGARENNNITGAGAQKLIAFLEGQNKEYNAIIQKNTDIANQISTKIGTLKVRYKGYFTQYYTQISTKIKTAEKEHIDFMVAIQSAINAYQKDIDLRKNDPTYQKEIAELQSEIKRLEGELAARKLKTQGVILQKKSVDDAKGIKPNTPQILNPAADAKTPRDVGQSVDEILTVLINLMHLSEQSTKDILDAEMQKQIGSLLSNRYIRNIAVTAAEPIVALLIGRLESLVSVMLERTVTPNPESTPQMQLVNKFITVNKLNQELKKITDPVELKKTTAERDALNKEINVLNNKLKATYVSSTVKNPAQKAQEAQSDLIDALITLLSTTKENSQVIAQNLIDMYAAKNDDGTKTWLGWVFSLSAPKAADILVPALTGAAIMNLKNAHQDPARMPVISTQALEQLNDRLMFAKPQEKGQIKKQIDVVANQILVKIKNFRKGVHDLGQNPSPSSEALKAVKKTGVDAVETQHHFQQELRGNRPAVGSHRQSQVQGKPSVK